MTESKTKQKRKSAEAEVDTQEDVFDAAAQREASSETAEEAESSGEGDKSIEQELEEARLQAQENHDKMLRLAADCENVRKRMQREKETALKYAEENVLREVLPAIDNLERAMEQGRVSNDVNVLLEGLELTLKGLLSSLEKYDLKPIESVGKPFDPNFHEAMAMEASDEVPAQNVLQEYEKGYLYKGKLIRAAKVVVSKGSSE